VEPLEQSARTLGLAGADLVGHLADEVELVDEQRGDTHGSIVDDRPGPGERRVVEVEKEDGRGFGAALDLQKVSGHGVADEGARVDVVDVWAAQGVGSDFFLRMEGNGQGEHGHDDGDADRSHVASIVDRDRELRHQGLTARRERSTIGHGRRS
jgi:hypothetical protein